MSLLTPQSLSCVYVMAAKIGDLSIRTHEYILRFLIDNLGVRFRFRLNIPRWTSNNSKAFVRIIIRFPTATLRFTLIASCHEQMLSI